MVGRLVYLMRWCGANPVAIETVMWHFAAVHGESLVLHLVAALCPSVVRFVPAPFSRQATRALSSEPAEDESVAGMRVCRGETCADGISMCGE